MLFLSLHMLYNHTTFPYSIPNSMMTNLNVLRPRRIQWVIGYSNGTVIVLINDYFLLFTIRPAVYKYARKITVSFRQIL